MEKTGQTCFLHVLRQHTFNFTLSATPALNWRVLPLKERPTAQTGLPAARYGAAYFFRCTCDIATFGGLFTFSSKMYVPQGWSATMSVRTRKEEHLLALCRGETVEPCRLIDIHVAPAADLAKVV